MVATGLACACACSPSGTTSNPLCPRLTGSAAVSSRVGDDNRPSASSVSLSVNGVGPGMHGGGDIRLLKTKVPYLNQAQGYEIKIICKGRVPLTLVKKTQEPAIVKLETIASPTQVPSLRSKYLTSCKYPSSSWL